MKHQKAIPAYDLIRALIAKVVVHPDILILHTKPAGLKKLMQEHFNIVLECHEEKTDMRLPYQSERVQNGAVVLKPEGKTDIFDLPPKALKKLVQGIIWRDEHFEGTAIKAIARREKCSHDYVSSAIFKSFKTLQNAA